MAKKRDPKEKARLAALWKEYKSKGGDDLRDELITSYLHLVKYVVGRLIVNLPQHVKVEDLYSTGIVGLVKAVDRYDPTMKNKFETYAILLIKGAIIDEMRSLDWVPRSVHQKANEVGTATAELQQKLGREPEDEELAEYMGLSMDELDSTMERIRPAVMIPLNADKPDNEENTHIAERIPDQKTKTSFEHLERKEFRELLEKAVLDLPEQEKMVLVLYYYENLMLKEIGKVLKVSESRISQIHTKALTRLRQRLKQFSSEYADML